MYTIINGDCFVALQSIPRDSVDCIVTDPPYGLTSITKRSGEDGSSARLSKGFMGKEWDGSGIEYNVEMWEKCLKVLKPGGYLLAFGGSRTYHRIACAIEDAGFEIRDCIMWLYGSGFPKSMNIGLAVDKKLGNESKVIGEGRSGGTSRAYQSLETTTAGAYQLKEAQNEWKGWGTALKPSYEPILVARKPFKGSLVDNVLKYGVGGLNIDECRVPITDEKDAKEYHFNNNGNMRTVKEDGERLGAYDGGWKIQKEERENPSGGRFPANIILDTQEGEEWRRYFYCAKASRKDRDEGLDSPNTHPTVKPTVLMQYLVRLVSPKGATILDPFMGSGSTGKAVAYENKERGADYKFIGIEKDPEYCKIAEARIKFTKEGK